MLFLLPDRTQLELAGNDRAKFLHGFCTNDVMGLAPGKGCEAFVCNIQGKVLAHIAVFHTETALWIDAPPGLEDSLFAHLDRYLINEDVQILRRTATHADLYLHGADGEAACNAVAGFAADQLRAQPILSHVTVLLGDAAAQIRSVDWLGERGCLISLPRSALAAVADRLVAAGASLGDIETWNALRIEAGFPLYGVDITSDNLAQEVNRTARCISFAKGCYLGQEPIARIDALGHVNRELHRVTFEGTEVPQPGTALMDPESNSQIGVVTSAARSATNPRQIVALGYLRTKIYAPGKKVVIRLPAGDVRAAVQ
jgi:folate-binding protein YgfZ